MHERIERLPAGLVSADTDELEREFETRLIESSMLAFRIAYSVLRHREDSEDVAQEAYAKAYRCFRQLRDREKFRAWMVRMTWRMAIDRRRSDRRRTSREQDSAVDPVTDPASAQDRAALVWQAIDALPEKLRIVTVLAGIEGHDMKEVGALLQVPVGTVKSRLFEARQRMKDWLSCASSSSSR